MSPRVKHQIYFTDYIYSWYAFSQYGKIQTEDDLTNKDYVNFNFL